MATASIGGYNYSSRILIFTCTYIVIRSFGGTAVLVVASCATFWLILHSRCRDPLCRSCHHHCISTPHEWSASETTHHRTSLHCSHCHFRLELHEWSASETAHRRTAPHRHCHYCCHLRLEPCKRSTSEMAHCGTALHRCCCYHCCFCLESCEWSTSETAHCRTALHHHHLHRRVVSHISH